LHESLAHALAGRDAALVVAFTTRAQARFDAIAWRAGDALLFGPESRGLSEQILQTIPRAQHVRLPMRPQQRSLNLSNAVAVAVFEAWRQLGYNGALHPPEAM
jgi:tRNA (cytidine/uridine-2'-O-)-methyltransferase